MSVQRVLIVETRSLLTAGIKTLLSQEPGLHVIAVAPESEVTLLNEIRRIQPDLIVLDEGSQMTELIKLLTHLEDSPEIRVVVLRADNSLARVYHKKQVIVTQLADLVTVIRQSGSASDPGPEDRMGGIEP